jgi:hypothetical protein
MRYLNADIQNALAPAIQMTTQAAAFAVDVPSPESFATILRDILSTPILPCSIPNSGQRQGKIANFEPAQLSIFL